MKVEIRAKTEILKTEEISAWLDTVAPLLLTIEILFIGLFARLFTRPWATSTVLAVGLPQEL